MAALHTISSISEPGMKSCRRNSGTESFGYHRAELAKFAGVETSYGRARLASALGVASFHEFRGKIWLVLTEKISLPSDLQFPSNAFA